MSNIASAVNGIRASLIHDEGAIAQCKNCNRYTLNYAALSSIASRQPVCDCGKQHYWTGGFRPPGADAQWFGPRPTTGAAQTTTVDDDSHNDLSAAIEQRLVTEPTSFDFQRRAQELAAEARRAGYVLTIEQQSLWPPAMGFHADIVSVRGVR